MPSRRRPLWGSPVALVGFFTCLPLGARASLESTIAAFPAVPLVGWLTGGIAAAAVMGFAPILPAPVLAGLVLALAVGLTGFSQTDGLLDLGDGLMAHGDPLERRRVMGDHAVGTGGTGLALFTYLLAFSALTGLGPAGPGGVWPAAGSGSLAAAVILAEVFCRLPMAALAWWGRPSHEGLGFRFQEGFGGCHVGVAAGVAAPALISAVWLGWLAVLLAGAATLLTAIVLLRISHRLLGGIGGDVLGASQELGRTAVLLAVALGLGLGSIG